MKLNKAKMHMRGIKSWLYITEHLNQMLPFVAYISYSVTYFTVKLQSHCTTTVTSLKLKPHHKNWEAAETPH